MKNYLPLSGGTITGEFNIANLESGDSLKGTQVACDTDSITMMIQNDATQFPKKTNSTSIDNTNFAMNIASAESSDTINQSTFIVSESGLNNIISGYNGTKTVYADVDFNVTGDGLSITNGYYTNEDNFETPKYTSMFTVAASTFFCSIGNNTIQMTENDFSCTTANNPTTPSSLVSKSYVDTKIAAIPIPDVSSQIEAHNTSTAAHANMHWLTADDEMLSSIEPDGSIDADTLEGHPASYFATKTDLSGYVLKSELSTLVPTPDLSNYYTKEEVDAKITQIQQLIDEAAALVDQINGEVI